MLLHVISLLRNSAEILGLLGSLLGLLIGFVFPTKFRAFIRKKSGGSTSVEDTLKRGRSRGSTGRLFRGSSVSGKYLHGLQLARIVAVEIASTLIFIMFVIVSALSAGEKLFVWLAR